MRPWFKRTISPTELHYQMRPNSFKYEKNARCTFASYLETFNDIQPDIIVYFLPSLLKNTSRSNELIITYYFISVFSYFGGKTLCFGNDMMIQNVMCRTLRVSVRFEEKNVECLQIASSANRLVDDPCLKLTTEIFTYVDRSTIRPSEAAYRES